MLDLTAKSRLQCIPANDAPLVEPAANTCASSRRRGGIVAAVATIFVIAAGLAGSWFLQEGSRLDQTVANAREGTIEAIAPATPPATGIDKLPTSEIPDLHAVGFRFISAETMANSSAIVFHYEAGSDRLSIHVSQAPASTNGSKPVAENGSGLSWQARHKSFAISGTVQQNRLRDVAAVLQKDSSAR